MVSGGGLPVITHARRLWLVHDARLYDTLPVTHTSQITTSMVPPSKIRIPQHVFTFSLAILPAVAYGKEHVGCITFSLRFLISSQPVFNSLPQRYTTSGTIQATKNLKRYYEKTTFTTFNKARYELLDNTDVKTCVLYHAHTHMSLQSRREEMQQFFKRLEKGDVKTEWKLNEVLKGGKNDIKRVSAVDTTLYGTEEGVEAKKRYEDEKSTKKKRKQKKTEEEILEHKTTTHKESVIKVAAVGTVVAAIVTVMIGGNRSR